MDCRRALLMAVMAVMFMLIFWVAQYPMDLIDGLFAGAAETLGRWLPEGDINSLVTDGLIGGVGGMLVFLPQICLLFFVLALLEDSGYMARAAFVMDRLMHRVGLPGKAFVPLLSAHACAIPAMMSTRVIEDRRDRLAGRRGADDGKRLAHEVLGGPRHRPKPRIPRPGASSRSGGASALFPRLRERIRRCGPPWRGYGRCPFRPALRP